MRGVLVIGALLGAVVLSGAAQAACVEGRRSTFTEYDSINDQHTTVVRTCVNGSYMTPAERAAYVYNPKGGCVEGRRSAFTEYDGSTDRHVTVTRVCRGGTYMTESEKAAYWSAVAKSKKPCAEGHEKFVDNYFGGDIYREYLVCTGGRYKVVSKKLIKAGSSD